MILEQHPELLKLSPAEKLALVSELWDNLVAHPDAVPVSQAQIAEIERRMEEYRKDPCQVTRWEEAKARIMSGGTRRADEA